MGADTLKRLKDATAGEFVTDATSLADRSFLIGTFADGRLAAGVDQRRARGYRGTTSADVQRAAKAYLQRYIVAFVATAPLRSSTR